MKREIAAVVAGILAPAMLGCGSIKPAGDAAADTSADKAPGGNGGASGAGGAAGTGGGGHDAGSGGAGGATADGGPCVADGGSCANGEVCCTGFTCCRGVPVQPGHEYCGQICPVSDRNMKRDFAPVDREAVLDRLARLPLSTWSYKQETQPARHIGPMAQDFKAAFGVGSSETTILQVDADGVAFAAIQALQGEVARLEKKNAALEREIAALRTRIERRARRHAH
jgi:hypothetical protein